MKLYLYLLFAWAIIVDPQSILAESCKSISTPATFAKIETALQQCKISRMEELLSILPPDFRSRYVLVHSSRSLQGASAQYPRVIMFGLDAKLILAFSGSPEMEGYDSLETIQFNDQTKKFHFRSISFPSKTGLSGVAVKPKISELDPERCKNCHRNDLRPNWDTYSYWPGVYGSVDDGTPAAEKEAYRNFMQTSYLKGERYRYFEDASQFPDQSLYYDYFIGRKNLQFTFLLSLLNSQANARAIKENPKLHSFRYAMLASLICRDDFNDPQALAQIIPPAITSGFSKSYEEISNQVTAGIQASHDMRGHRQEEILSALSSLPLKDWEHKFKPLEFCCASKTSRLRYIMEVAGVPFPQWSMEFGSRNYVFFGGEVGQVGELGLYLWQELLDPVHDKELYQIYQHAWENRTNRGEMLFSGDIADLCGQLKAKSLAALSAH